MQTQADIATALQRSEFHDAALRAVARCGLPDCWISAGFVRNFVWDRLHGYSEMTPLNDIDVVYFDPNDPSNDRETETEACLAQVMPGQIWQVRNQARMHISNNEPPYRSSTEAISHYLETPTAIAARHTGEGVELAAPLGVSDLLGLIIRPTSTVPAQQAAFRDRAANKDWLQTWPKLALALTAE